MQLFKIIITVVNVIIAKFHFYYISYNKKMSLLKWEDLAKRKSQLGNKINLVRETIKNKKIDDEPDQTGYEKFFKPVTKLLEKKNYFSTR